MKYIEEKRIDNLDFIEYNNIDLLCLYMRSEGST